MTAGHMVVIVLVYAAVILAYAAGLVALAGLAIACRALALRLWCALNKERRRELEDDEEARVFMSWIDNQKAGRP